VEPKVTLPDLLARCLRSGDDNAWQAWVEYLQPLIAGVAARSALRWGSVQPDVVQDLTQEAFLKLCKNRFAILRKMEGQPEEMIVAFIRVTVAHLVHDHFRAERSAKRFPAGGFLTTDALDNWLGETRTMSRTERELLLGEIDKLLKEKLTGPSAGRDRQVFWFHHRHGMTAKAISSIPAIRLSEKGVESVLFRLGVLVKEELAAGKGIGAPDSYR
jgi:DNA-directed RNA polymerase specialized sigma24 family protein